MAAVAKDPAIKLFGRTISLPEAHFSDDSESLDNGSSLMTKTETGEYRNENSGTMDEAASFEPCKGEQSSTSMQHPVSSQATLKSKGHDEESDDTEEPIQNKRPDKILTCPRCNSSDTKFCYFNNYNVNQPRHFCKSCQRYWTAGGTVRNVPVGAGRRRNKHLASQYRQIIACSDGGPTTVVETPDSTIQLVSCEESASSCTASTASEMVLKFGPESPHCDSRPILSSQRPNGCSEIDLRNSSVYENRGLPCSSPSTASSIAVRGISNDVPLQQPMYHCGIPPQIAALIPNSNNSLPFPVPGYAPPDISYQFVPAPYWNCIPVWVAGSGSISLAVSNGCVSPPMFSGTEGNGLQVLGKHSRDTNVVVDEFVAKGNSPSKALRIRDLDEA